MGKGENVTLNQCNFCVLCDDGLPDYLISLMEMLMYII